MEQPFLSRWTHAVLGSGRGNVTEARVGEYYVTQYLKIVGNENQGRSGRWHTFGIGLGTVAIDVLLSFIFYQCSVGSRREQSSPPAG